MTKLTLRCYVCNVTLGESSNALLVDGLWIHHKCAFGLSVNKINKEFKNDSRVNIEK